MEIEISKDIQKELDKRKSSSDDTYEEIIWDLLEDTMELSEETKKRIENARKEIEQGKFLTLKQFKEKLDIT